MREYSSPLTVEVPATGNLTDDVVHNAAEAPDAVAFSRRRGDDWEDVTAGRFLDEVRAVAKGLVAAGIETGDRVALISKTRYEWTLVDYAIWFAGAVTVPVYETSSRRADRVDPGRLRRPAVVAEGPAHTARIAERRVEPRLAQPRVVPRGQRHRGATPSRRGHLRRRPRGPAYDGDAARPGHHHLHLRAPPAGPRAASSPTATSCSSSGWPSPSCTSSSTPRTPRPSSSCRWPTSSPGSSRSGAIKARVRLGHSADIKHLLPDLDRFQPTFILAVPRVFEKVFNTASQKATAEGRGGIFERAADTAIAYSRALDRGKVPVALRARHAALLPARLRSAARRARRSAAGTPSPAARRSATGSATSTAASAWSCSRATASPRRPPP